MGEVGCLGRMEHRRAAAAHVQQHRSGKAQGTHATSTPGGTG